MNFTRNMQTIRIVFNIVEAIMTAFWGLVTISFFTITPEMKFNAQELISSWSQSLYIVIGIVYFVMNGVYRHQNKQLERDKKKLENRRMQMDLDRIENNRKKN